MEGRPQGVGWNSLFLVSCFSMAKFAGLPSMASKIKDLGWISGHLDLKKCSGCFGGLVQEHWKEYWRFFHCWAGCCYSLKLFALRTTYDTVLPHTPSSGSPSPRWTSCPCTTCRSHSPPMPGGVSELILAHWCLQPRSLDSDHIVHSQPGTHLAEYRGLG